MAKAKAASAAIDAAPAATAAAPSAEVTIHSAAFDEARQGFDVAATIISTSGNRSGREFVSLPADADGAAIKAAVAALYGLTV